VLKVGAGIHETDAEWEKWGASDPYFGVLTHDRYRASGMTAADHAEFFASGRDHVAAVLANCRRHFGESFRPARVLDFGCGVGRLVVPFAETCDAVVGVDVSDSMLAEAKRNCARFGVTNATLLRADDALGAVDGRFELVHSTIVFQHIESERGLDILARLVDLVAPGGIAAIHVTYGRSYGNCRYGRPLPDLPAAPPPPTLRRRLRSMVRQLVRPSPASQPEPPSLPDEGRDPVMRMYHYDLSRVAYILHAAGAAGFHADFTDHGGELGATLYARMHTPAGTGAAPQDTAPSMG
jgi:SAM-dependent methyltransferase